MPVDQPAKGHRAEPLRCHHYTVFDLTCEEFDRLRARAAGRCEICGVGEQELHRQTLVIDHCKTTGYVRGLLCGQCNSVVMARLDGNRPWGTHRKWEVEAKAYRNLPRISDARCRVLDHSGGLKR